MGKKQHQSLVWNIKQVFKSEDSRFIASVGLKVSAISFCVSTIAYFFLFEFMRLNHTFFSAHGKLTGQEENLFFEYLMQEASGNLSLFFAFHIILFFIGSYVGWLILRPFRCMGEYCESVLENPNQIFKVDEFSTYRLLTRFSEFFFEYLRESRKKGKLLDNSIPPQFLRIHQPVLDRVFMLHFGLLLLIITISSSVFIIENSSSIYNSMVELATQTLSDPSGIGRRFFSQQIFILDDIITLTVILLVASYTSLGLHLYAKVSGGAFAIFSTMRAFMKGNFSSRVHLVGYAYLREHTRKLNKYLEYMQNSYEKE